MVIRVDEARRRSGNGKFVEMFLVLEMLPILYSLGFFQK